MIIFTGYVSNDIAVSPKNVSAENAKNMLIISLRVQLNK